MKVHLTIDIPKSRHAELMAHLRAFEQTAPKDIHMHVFVEAPELSAEQIVEDLRVAGIDKRTHDITITKNGGIS